MSYFSLKAAAASPWQRRWLCGGSAALLLGASGSLQAQAPAQTQPFSAVFFPEPGQLEINVGLTGLSSRYQAQSAVLQHEGTTRTGLITPGFRWGWAPGWALELSQPVAHRFQVDANNPNVGPEGLRAPTLTAMHRTDLGRGLAWRTAGSLQLNPWHSSGLQQWGGSVTAESLTAAGSAATLGLAWGLLPATDQQQWTLNTSWGQDLGGRWLQLGASVAHYSAYANASARMHASQGRAVYAELSQAVQPRLWAGIRLGLATHHQTLDTVPTPQLPLSLPATARTRVWTVGLTLRHLY